MKRAAELTSAQEKKMLGFWIYLMTDLVLFASLFATFAVLRSHTFGGPSGADIFNMPFVLLETMILLTSSFTAGLAILGSNKGYDKPKDSLLVVSFIASKDCETRRKTASKEDHCL